jgi:hypothetical protein
MSDLWRGEFYKATIYFDEDTTYTVYKKIDDISPNYIRSLKFSNLDGKTTGNILGTNVSNKITLSIFDADDNLNPKKTTGPYYGKFVNGIKIVIQAAYDGKTWEDAGTYYTDSWSGGFGNGYCEPVTITAEDRLNAIGDRKIPNLKAYANVNIRDLIVNVLTGVGIEESDIIIDESLNTTLNYGVSFGSTVREFINSSCQLLMARCKVNRHNKIEFTPALVASGNKFSLTGADITGKIQVRQTSAIMYNKVVVKYLKGGDKILKTIIDSNGYSLKSGDNVLEFIPFEDIVLAVYQLYIKPNESGSIVTHINLDSYVNGVSVSYGLTGSDVDDCHIYAEGRVLNTSEETVELDVPNSTQDSGMTFEFNTKAVMTKEEATQLANDLVQYLIKFREIITFDSLLTGKAVAGDELTLTGAGEIYNGVYKIIADNLDVSETFTHSTSCIRA